MAIRRFSDYDKTKSYTDFEQLPKGGYVLIIKGAEVCHNSVGEYTKIMCDIAEGEFKDHFLSEYCGQQKEDKKWHCNYLLNTPKDDGSEKDGWTKRRFKTVTEALEDSNPGYHFDWDERKFKGKMIGGLFNEREYENDKGEIKRATNLAQLCSVDKIRSGNYKIPDDKLLGGRPPQTSAPMTDADEFINIPDGIDDELPFH